MRRMTTPGSTQPPALSDLPSVDALLRHQSVTSLSAEYPRPELLAAIREVLDATREAIRAGRSASVAIPRLAIDVRTRLHRRAQPNLRRVINATGIVLHTGLGRAPLADEALAAISEVAAGYCNLELDLETGERGDRHALVRNLLRELTGAPDALVVNNNAAATLLTLQALTNGREVIISRGQLVEIGGSYRMPDIMAAAGCRMIEVGTTNRTRIADYERALSEHTAGLVHVHTSNYRIHGFTETVGVSALVELARRFCQSQPLLVIDDLGSGLLDSALTTPQGVSQLTDDVPLAGAARAPVPCVDAGGLFVQSTEVEAATDAEFTPRSHDADNTRAWDEPTVRQSVANGADVTLFSGDKLLGGPQAGIIIGRADLLAKIRSNPLARALRPDKLTLAALEATLRLYRDPATVARRIPALRMLTTSTGEIHTIARQLEAALRGVLPDATVELAPDETYAGGGALPTLALPTWITRLRIPNIKAADLAAALRRRHLPVICRVHNDAVVFDCRTIGADEAEQIPPAVCEALQEIADD